MWNTFADFHEYLELVFPRVYAPLFLQKDPFLSLAIRYAKLEVTKVNTYGLVYHWQGATDVKPILLAAHQG